MQDEHDEIKNEQGGKVDEIQENGNKGKNKDGEETKVDATDDNTKEEKFLKEIDKAIKLIRVKKINNLYECTIAARKE